MRYQNTNNERKTMNERKQANNVVTGLHFLPVAAFIGLAAGVAEGQVNPSSINFGSDEDGAGLSDGWEFGGKGLSDDNVGTALGGTGSSTVVIDLGSTAIKGTRSSSNPYGGAREFAGISDAGASFNISGEITVDNWGDGGIGLGLWQDPVNGGKSTDWQSGPFVKFFDDQRLLIRGGSGEDWLTNPNDSTFQSSLSVADGTTYSWDVDASVNSAGDEITISATISDGSDSFTSSGTTGLNQLAEFGDYLAFGDDSSNGEFSQNTFAVVPEPRSYAVFAGLLSFAAAMALRRRRS